MQGLRLTVWATCLEGNSCLFCNFLNTPIFFKQLLKYSVALWDFPEQFRVATGQGKVREKLLFSRSGKSQGILSVVREF